MEFGKADSASAHTRTSINSYSSTSSTAVKARAKAEAAKIQAAFADKEAKLKVEKAAKEEELHLGKAKLEAELSALTLHKAYVQGQADIKGPQATMSIQAIHPPAVLSETSYATWNPPSVRNTLVHAEQEENEIPHRSFSQDASLPQPYISNHA